ncbi:fimbria/pilus outer membrane usher protein [Ramlibacter humi]|nr:fimbria/pilus outer membrane usher protein [Ramlibacter humi]
MGHRGGAGLAFARACAAAALLAFGGATPAQPVKDRPAPDVRLQPMEVRLNGRSLGTWPLLSRNGALHVRVADLPAWGVRPRQNALLREESGQLWYPLAAIEGAELRLLSSENRVDLLVPPPSLLPAGTPPLPGDLAPMPATARNEAGTRLLPLEVIVNGSRSGNWLLLERDGALHAPEEAFTEWRLARPAQAPVEFRGQRWHPLSSVAGFEPVLDPVSQVLQLQFSPAAFAATRLSPEAAPRPPVTPAIPAAFLNYDVDFTAQSQRGAAATRDFGALLEAGLSGSAGVLTSSFLVTGHPGAAADGAGRWRRLETAFTRDLPDSGTTVRLGDSATRAGVAGRAVYFGGIQAGRNSALAPGVVTQPLAALSGVSVAPSTVELYVNDTLRQTAKVPAGPFTIENPGALTGSGQARVVVRDLLGRETVVVQDFFTHDSLLGAGLSDWSVEAGAVRRNLAQRDADYGQAFASGLYRRGISDSRTAEAKAELGSRTQALTLALSTALSAQSLAQVAVSRSHDRGAGGGWLAMAGIENRHLRHGFSVRLDGATPGYRQLGFSDSLAFPRLAAVVAYDYTHPVLGTLGFTAAKVVNGAAGALHSISISDTVRVGSDAALVLSLNRVGGSTSAISASLSLVVPLGRWTSSTSASRRDGRTEGYTAASLPLAQETGLGSRVLAGSRAGRGYSEGGLYYQGGKGYASADLSVSGDAQALRLGGSGGVAFADGHAFLARRIEDSFAVVSVPGYADVGIGFQGGTLTRTDAQGTAILPRLRPYESNSIRIDARELPINAELDDLEQVAVPPARSAVKVVFPVRSGRGALIRLVLDDGGPAPAGAQVEVLGDRKEFFVARRGEAFVTGLQDHGRIRLLHRGQECTVDVDLPPPSADEIPRVGPLTCAGVRR